MRLTIEENREAIKRYRHIKPGPLRGSVPCSAMCPGTVRICTLKRGHGGPHVAHGTFKRVLAVWDKGIKAGGSGKKAKWAAGAISRPRPRKEGLIGALRAFRDRVARRAPSMEEGLFLILGLFLAGYFLAMILGLVSWG